MLGDREWRLGHAQTPSPAAEKPRVYVSVRENGANREDDLQSRTRPLKGHNGRFVDNPQFFGLLTAR